MSALLLVLLASSPLAVPTLNANERVPVIAVVLTPREAESAFDVTSARATLDALLDSPYRLLPADLALERCAGSPSCILGNLGSADQDARLLVVLALRARGYVSCVIFDLPRARALLRERAASASSPDDLDGLLFEEAALADTTASPRSLVELKLALASPIALAAGRITDVARRGAMVLDADLAGAVIDLDGRVLGLTVAGTQRIIEVRPGARTLQLVAPDRPPVSRLVEVTAGATTTVSVAMLPPPFVFPHATVWPTVTLLGLGATFAAVGITRRDDFRAACFPPNCGEVGASARLFGDDGAGAGPLPLALGYSLAASGVAFLVARQLADEDTPWWFAPVVAGAVATLTYTTSELVEAAR